jgi:hypothetical protein
VPPDDYGRIGNAEVITRNGAMLKSFGRISAFVIEETFHEMKDRHIGAWWPMRHWTDSKIQVHGLYCTIAVLLRALRWRRARQAGLRLSMSGLLKNLGQMSSRTCGVPF